MNISRTLCICSMRHSRGRAGLFARQSNALRRVSIEMCSKNREATSMHTYVDVVFKKDVCVRGPYPLNALWHTHPDSHRLWTAEAV
jgi:hypothetical protein